MSRIALIAAASALLIAGGSPAAFAAPCKDAKGKFVKCPEAKKTPMRCRANGKFAKCGTPGAKPM